jgi:hypothetical protein
MNFTWLLVVVYGVAYEEDEDDFIIELANVCSDQTFPLLIGGDFNLSGF